MKAKYIDKTFPITLQDLIDLTKSENLDPKDLKLIMNSNQADLSSYVQCALLNQDCDKISIELYTEANDGLHEDLQLKQQTNTQDRPLTKAEDRYRKELLALVENMECDDDLSPTSITSILKQGSKGYI
jgi:hypothetical protein